jgi:hypothetical protein
MIYSSTASSPAIGDTGPIPDIPRTIHLNGAAHDPPPSTGRPSPASPPAQAMPNDPLAGMTPKRIFTDCIWISKEPATNKLLLLCISRYFKPNATSSSLSYPQIAQDCGFSERTGIRAAQDVRDRWLRIGIQQGHKTASGQKNLYVGTPPPDLVEELRHRKAKGEVVEPDEAIVAAAQGMTPCHPLPEEGMTPCHPLPEEGMTPCHPSGQRGDTVSERGDTDDTLILNKQEKKKESGADAPPPPVHGQSKKEGKPEAPPENQPLSTRGTRLPNDWSLPDEWRAPPRQRGLSERQIDEVAKGFFRYWTTQSGQKAVKLNWPRVWENWIDNQIVKYGLKPAGANDLAGATPKKPKPIPRY